MCVCVCDRFRLTLSDYIVSFIMFFFFRKSFIFWLLLSCRFRLTWVAALNLIKNNSIIYFYYGLLFKMFYMFLKNKIYCVQWEKGSCFLPRHLKITYFRPVMAILLYRETIIFFFSKVIIPWKSHTGPCLGEWMYSALSLNTTTRCPWARHRTPNCSPGAAA